MVIRRFNEGVTLSDEIIRLDFRPYMDLYVDNDKRVSLTGYEIGKIKDHFKEFPSFKVDDYSDQTTLSNSGKGFIVLKKSRIEVSTRGEKRIIISKIEDEWFLVNIRMSSSMGGYFKVDQLNNLFKLLDDNLQKVKRVDLDKVRKEKAEKNRILDMRNKLRHKIGIMSVEELDKWTKEWGLL